MAYQLKTTGIAANCTMCIAVDPDTSTVKDFASSSVTADMTVGANVTIGSQAWDGVTRYYWRTGSGTADADFVKFGTTKPWVGVDASHVTQTLVCIGAVAGAGTTRVFGNDSTDYFASANTTAGGNTYPTLYMGSTNLTGGWAQLSAGTKCIFGASVVRGTTRTIFSAVDTDAAMTTSTAAFGTPTAYYALTYVNRRNDSSSHLQDKTHAILAFSTALSEAEWDTLRDDWFGTLLEAAAGGSAGTATGTLAAIAIDAASATGTGKASATGSLPSVTLAAVTATAVGGAGTPSLTLPALKNNTGTVLASETGATAHVYTLAGALVVTKTAQTTNGSGVMVITDAALTAGTQYRVVIVLASGAEGMDKVTAA